MNRSGFKFLRSIGLVWLVPFYFCIETYRQNALTRLLILTFRFGRTRWEVWDLRKEFEMDWLEGLIQKQATPSEVYDRIRLSGQMVASAKNFKEAKDLFWRAKEVGRGNRSYGNYCGRDFGSCDRGAMSLTDADCGGGED